MERTKLEELISGCPLHRFLGIKLEDMSVDEESVTLSVVVREEFSRSDDRQELHGGILAALIDIAGDYAVALKVGSGVPTINLRVDYLRMARGGKAVAKARILRCGRTIATVDIEVRDETNALVAVGRGAYSSAIKG